ncbi:hypothetical protein GCM10010466_30420 [Planomonospora alba]|uniref:Uncharacterized protein n=1 Tax=Planomonospora alba TaxID=161354 RepID=A0ABP6N6A3_9ACTN
MSKTLMRIASTGVTAAALILSVPSVAMAGGGNGCGWGACGYGGGYGGWGGYGGGWGGNGAFYNANQTVSGPYGAANYNINTGTGGWLW